MLKRIALLAATVATAAAAFLGAASPASAAYTCIVTADIHVVSSYTAGGARYKTLAGSLKNTCPASNPPPRIYVTASYTEGIRLLQAKANTKYYPGASVSVSFTDTVYCGAVGGASPLNAVFKVAGYGSHVSPVTGNTNTSGVVSDTVTLACTS